MLVTLANMKTYLGISSSTYDTFLTEQLNLISDTVESYCRRIFSSASYTQTFYREDYLTVGKRIETFQYPISAVTSIKEDGILLDAAEYRVNKESGIITKINTNFFNTYTTLEIIYTAGFSSIPTPIDAVVKSIVEERYNKKISGVSLNFGSDVQRISIPGTISIDYDYTLTANDRKNTFGNILGNYMNNLDFYRSERALIGSSRLTYVA